MSWILSQSSSRARHSTAALCGGCVRAGATASPDYPNKPIRVIVPSPPGGPPDLIARILATKLQAALGQPVVVENRAGAGGMVGTAYVAKPPPDGYTWLFTTASHTNIPPFNDNVAVRPGEGLHPRHAGWRRTSARRWSCTPSLPAKNVQELIALARKKPGQAHLRPGRASAPPATSRRK